MAQTITEENGVVTSTPIPNDESFYLERFKKKIVEGNWLKHGRLVDSDYYCELYKGFAIVTWKREVSTPTKGVTTIRHESFVWEIGGYFDNISELGWLGQGCVTSGWGAPTVEKALSKVRKKIDLLALMYSERKQLQALSIVYCRRVAYDEPHVFNATVGDIVLIRAFGRPRLGKIVATVGSRFIVAYMTPSNSLDVHYKTLPLTNLYPKEITP
jgi:hypothetical protein